MIRKQSFSIPSLFLVLLALPARAGDGNIEPPDQDDASDARKISLNVTFTTPLTAAQFSNAQEQFILANRTVCNMTDGMFRISKITAWRGEQGLEKGDIWVFPQSGTHNGGGLGNFGETKQVQLGPDGQIQTPNHYSSSGHVTLYLQGSTLLFASERVYQEIWPKFA